MPTQQPSSLSAFRYNYCPRARRQPFTRDRDPLSTYSGQGCPLRRIIQKTPKGFAEPDFLIHIHYSLFTIHYSGPTRSHGIEEPNLNIAPSLFHYVVVPLPYHVECTPCSHAQCNGAGGRGGFTRNNYYAVVFLPLLLSSSL